MLKPDLKRTAIRCHRNQSTVPGNSREESNASTKAQAYQCKAASPNNYQYSLSRHQHLHNTPSNHFREAISSKHLPSAATDPVAQPHQQASCISSTNQGHPQHNIMKKSTALGKSQAGTQQEGSDNQAAGERMKAAPGDAIQPQTRPVWKNCHIPTALTMAKTYKAPRPHKTTESSAPTSKEMPRHSISRQAQSQFSTDRKSEEQPFIGIQN
ncbi:hypothetical protein Nepgr_021050 [Nepenthes gracilis]|uniref:Uncharacterized protein n=1 Tax=Nepenthes gracilis TaxID=150966 RepID=A0AAD3SY23_NEPGR|nr:hypothetical protein Nepgr_021050 [Nepenthes gracilis]